MANILFVGLANWNPVQFRVKHFVTSTSFSENAALKMWYSQCAANTNSLCTM